MSVPFVSCMFVRGVCFPTAKNYCRGRPYQFVAVVYPLITVYSVVVPVLGSIQFSHQSQLRCRRRQVIIVPDRESGNAISSQLATEQQIRAINPSHFDLRIYSRHSD